MSKELSAGQLLLQKKKVKEAPVMEDEEIINEWESLFPTPEEAHQMKLTAQQLTNAKLGKRKKESDLEYLMRVSYCKFCGIDLSLVNTVYIVEGKPARYVELKGILWAKKYPKKDYPKRELQTLVSTAKKCFVRGTVDGEHWVEVEYDLKKAELNNRNYNSNPHWKYNTQKMLVKSAKGDFFDIMSDTPMTENLVEGEE